MPLPVRTKWGMALVQQPLFCQYLGLFSREEVSESQVEFFLRSLGRHFPYISVYDFHPCHTVALRRLLPTCPDFEVLEKTTHWLNLEKSYVDLASEYTVDRTKNLKKSRKYLWEWVESDDIEPLIQLFKENHAIQIQGIHESAYVLLRTLIQLLQEKKVALIRYTYRHGKIHAGIMILENKGMGIYIFNAADAVGRKGNARTFLLDRYFQEKAGRIEAFDFESPEVPSIAQFYQSFGASQQTFISLKKNKLPFPFRQLQNIRKLLFRTFRH
ncbi:GNAT family N-acetyltransferase [Salmonirosea aquatica]|uniref:GNAT family N-acetyltransferase n=1 Tax=Salmonirosea aquatica TaxID=2654236 RepID=A0A7C9BAJ1_9BACT|nr:GNAT family N-acetyltransferase [Cytophagaceae bacterium SJW1-29]